jgi:ammonia channel protein AmtB
MNGVQMLLALVSTAGVLVAAVMLAIIGARLGAFALSARSVLVPGGVGLVVAAAGWMSGMTGIPAVFAPPVIAFGIFFGVAVTMRHRERGAGPVRTGLFALIMTALVFLPSVTIVFATWYDPFATGIGYIDLGAALPTAVATGAAVVAVSVIERRSTALRGRPAQGWSVLWPALVLWVGWVAWLAGLELAIDPQTALIVEDALLMPAAAAIAFALVERARHRRNTVRGIALGLIAGCAAATPAAGYLIPLLAVVTALLVGAIAALVPFDDETSGARSIAGSLLIGGGISIVLLGFLAQDVGFIYTGQPEISFGQLLSVALVGVGGFVLAALAWLLLRKRAGEMRRGNRD